LCQLRAQRLTHSYQLRLQGLKAWPRTRRLRIVPSILQAGHHADDAVVGRVVPRLASPRMRRDLVFVDHSVALGRRQLARRDVDVAEAEGAVLPAAHERQPSQRVDHGHRIGKTVQRVPAENGILVDEGIGLGPVHLEPLRRDVQRLGKCRHAISPQQRGTQGGQ
jgi:hypothetical protein